MAENKKLQTRILLKYDSYQNWMDSTFPLLKGEVAIAYITNEEGNSSQQVNSVALPQTLIKVGDGTHKYSELPFVSGLAADVYGWAKSSKKPTYELSEIGDACEYRLTELANHKFQLQRRMFGANQNWTNIDPVIDLTAYANKSAAKVEFKFADDNKSVDILKSIEEIDGEIKVEKQTLVFNSAYNASTNKIATMADLQDIVTDIYEGTTVVGVDGDQSGTEVTFVDMVKQTNGALEAELGTIHLKTAQSADNKIVTEAEIKAVNDRINELDYSMTAGTQDGTVVKFVDKVSQTDGKVTAELGEINLKTAQSASNKIVTEADIASAIAELAVTGVDGDQSGTSVTFVDKISQTNGTISAELGTIHLASAHSPENPIATIEDVKTTVKNLNGAMEFKGVFDALPVIDATYNPGDVVAVREVHGAGESATTTLVEYILWDGKWEELGDQSIGTQAVQDALGGLNVSKDLDANETVDVIAQVNGALSVTKQKIAITHDQITDWESALPVLPNVSVSDVGDATATNGEIDVISTLDAEGHTVKYTNGKAATKAYVDSHVTDILKDLKNNDAAVAGQYVSAVKQTNGIIEVSRADLPTLSHTDGTATAATAETVTVVADINASGHTISDTRYNNVVTTVGLENAINDLDATIEASKSEAKTDAATGDFYVFNKIVEENGVLNEKTSGAVKLAKLANTANVNDLVQTSGDYIVFECGSATVNI